MNVDDDFSEVRECTYKDERYSVRDNGAVFRYSHENKPKRKNDNRWSFGTPNKQNGYMYLGQARVHRIVALAFLGEPLTNEHIVDHIDTNRKNNRPENLRYLTKLENAIINPITRSKIIHYCGSIEAFLQNPKILREKAPQNTDKNLEWMRQVSPTEAQNCLKNLQYLSLRDDKNAVVSQGMGEWIYQPISFNKQEHISISGYDTEAIFPKIARQRNWKTPSKFPLCPKTKEQNPLETYMKNLQKDEVFSSNQYGTSVIMEYALLQGDITQKNPIQSRQNSKDLQIQDFEVNENVLLVFCKFEPPNVKKYSLAKVTYENDCFIHTALGTYFDENAGYKYFTLAQGLEWKGGEVFDDYC